MSLVSKICSVYVARGGEVSSPAERFLECSSKLCSCQGFIICREFKVSRRRDVRQGGAR